ncbi:hypothetical protein [Ralstonia chuxiongensis]|uniref:hypothetical protein n=1 Tax=Ralstonia chuxiongensis TaxID=2957504 RepID=UPI00292D84E0|nr:hypothetical protein [Ralstonia chuxiongensis]
MRIEQAGAVYRLLDWGLLIKRAGALRALKETLNASGPPAGESRQMSRTVERPQ